MSARFLLVAVIASCAGCSTPAPGEKKPVSMEKRPHPELAFDRGPALTPSKELFAWLDARGDERVRLPVTITLDEHRIAIRRAELGETAIEVSDLKLGVSLLDRARQHCPKDARRCVLRLIGKWRAGRLDVERVDGLAPEGAAHAEVARG